MRFLKILNYFHMVEAAHAQFMLYSPKTMVSHLSKQRMHDYYERFQHELSESGFAVDEPSFIQRMRKIKTRLLFLAR